MTPNKELVVLMTYAKWKRIKTDLRKLKKELRIMKEEQSLKAWGRSLNKMFR